MIGIFRLLLKKKKVPYLISTKIKLTVAMIRLHSLHQITPHYPINVECLLECRVGCHLGVPFCISARKNFSELQVCKLSFSGGTDCQTNKISTCPLGWLTIKTDWLNLSTWLVNFRCLSGCYVSLWFECPEQRPTAVRIGYAYRITKQQPNIKMGHK